MEAGEESQRVVYRKVERHGTGTVSRNWLRTGRSGRRLCVAYTLAQGEKGNDDDGGKRRGGGTFDHFLRMPLHFCLQMSSII